VNEKHVHTNYYLQRPRIVAYSLQPTAYIQKNPGYLYPGVPFATVHIPASWKEAV